MTMVTWPICAGLTKHDRTTGEAFNLIYRIEDVTPAESDGESEHRVYRVFVKRDNCVNGDIHAFGGWAVLGDEPDPQAATRRAEGHYGRAISNWQSCAQVPGF